MGWRMIELSASCLEQVAQAKLTKSELAVFFKLIETTLTSKEIGSKLGIAEKTVKFHISNIHIKTKCCSRLQLIFKFRDL